MDINTFTSTIAAHAQSADNAAPNPDLRLWSDPAAGLECYYAPFDYVNAEAKIVLIGITPGRTQMNRSLNAAAETLRRGTPLGAALRGVKREGSFGGDMRKPLVELLNKLGYARTLGISCASRLWHDCDDLVHFCSLLKYPVFYKGSDYNSTPKIIGNARLMEMVKTHFVGDLMKLPKDAVLLPLGETVLEVLVHLSKQGVIPQNLMKWQDEYVAIPHPSGQNGETVALVLQDQFQTLDSYVDSKYRSYLEARAWLRKGRSAPQSPEIYRGKRATYWQSARRVRLAHGLA